MEDIAREVEEQVLSTKHGFHAILKVSEELLSTYSQAEIKLLAYQLYGHNARQMRMVAVFLMGALASTDEEVLAFLRTKVSGDDSWQVQEILAKAFDEYCGSIGYENALPEIEHWLHADTANVRRAASEGLRVWTSRPYFDKRPEVAVSYLAALRADESEYVRKSIGNAIRDISKEYPELVIHEIAGWDTTHKDVNQTYKLVIKRGLLDKQK